MKRNLELIRELLFYFDNKSTDHVVRSESIELDDYAPEDIQYHLVLMFQAGFLSGEGLHSGSTPRRIIEVLPQNLTWEGHEYLDSIRDDEVWRKIKNLGPTIGGLTFSMIKELGMAYAKTEIERLFGVEIN